MTEYPDCKSENVFYIVPVPFTDYTSKCMYQCGDCKKVFVDW